MGIGAQGDPYVKKSARDWWQWSQGRRDAVVKRPYVAQEKELVATSVELLAREDHGKGSVSPGEGWWNRCAGFGAEGWDRERLGFGRSKAST